MAKTTLALNKRTNNWTQDVMIEVEFPAFWPGKTAHGFVFLTAALQQGGRVVELHVSALNHRREPAHGYPYQKLDPRNAAGWKLDATGSFMVPTDDYRGPARLHTDGHVSYGTPLA